MALDLDDWLDVSRATCALAVALAACAAVARSTRALRLAALGLSLGTLAAFAALAGHGLRLEGPPLLLPADVALACALLLAALATAFAARARPDGVRAAAALLGTSALLAFLSAGHFAEARSVVVARPPALRSPWMLLHAGAWCVAIAAACAGVIARAASRGRDARMLRFAERSADAAFAAATLALASGCVWSLQAWSVVWFWSPKSILALLAWGALAAHALGGDEAERRAVWRERAPAVAALVMLVNLFASGYLPGAQRNALHGYSGLVGVPGVVDPDLSGSLPPMEFPLEAGAQTFPLHAR